MTRGYCEYENLRIKGNAVRMNLSSKFLIIVSKGESFR